MHAHNDATKQMDDFRGVAMKFTENNSTTSALRGNLTVKYEYNGEDDGDDYDKHD